MTKGGEDKCSSTGNHLIDEPKRELVTHAMVMQASLTTWLLKSFTACINASSMCLM